MTQGNIVCVCLGWGEGREREKGRRELLWWYLGGYLEEFLTVGIVCFFPLGRNLHYDLSLSKNPS